MMKTKSGMPFDERTQGRFLRAVRASKPAKAPSAQEMVEAWLEREKALGEDAYRLALKIGGPEGTTLGGLIEAGQWEEALAVIHRVETGTFW